MRKKLEVDQNGKQNTIIVKQFKSETPSQEKKESPAFEKAENKKGIELAMKRKKKEKSKKKSYGKKK